MQRLNSRTDSCMRGNNTVIMGEGMRKNFPNNIFNIQSGFIWMILVGLALVISAGPAFSQLSVTPMKLDLSVTSNKIITNVLEIQNHDTNEVVIADLVIGDLTQSKDGSWEVVNPNFDPNDPNYAGVDLSNYDTSKLSSCRDWVTVTPETLNIDPGQAGQVMVDVKVPRRSRGFYGAGILISFRARPDMDTDVSIRVRFLVPILLQVQGRTIRSDIDLDDVGMELINSTPTRSADAIIWMDVSNNGGTYSRLRPLARLWNYSNEHWRLITSLEFGDSSIIPGVNLKLGHSVRRSLPSGKYKLVGLLYVDGRRSRSIEKIIDFVGEPSVTSVASDTPLDLVPGDVSLECMPGSTRLTSLKVYNASQETINVQTAIGLQPALQNAFIKELKGEDLDCTNWLKISPQNFTLSSYGQQNITITSTMPDTAVVHPSYYSLLALWTSYPDGQRAGVRTANICVTNPQVEGTPQIEATNIEPAGLGNSKYLFGAKFINFGSVHITPIACRAVVVTETGIPRASTLLTSYEKDTLLPLEVRNYSGIMDFTAVDPGMYRVAVSLAWGPGANEMVQNQIQVRVSVEGEERLVEVIRTSLELPNKIEVQW